MHQRRERRREAAEVHVAGVCVKWEDGDCRIFLARRSADRDLFPGLWEGCGGQVRFGETFSDGVRRHYRDEMGLKVSVLNLYSVYEIDIAHGKIPGVRYLCEYESGEASSENHTEIVWASLDELISIPESKFPPSFKSGVLSLLAIYFSLRSGRTTKA